MRAEVTRSFIIMRRYWFATIISLVVGYGFMMSLIYAFMYNKDAATKIADQATSGALGFILGLFSFGIIGMFSQGMQSMARSGELEQVCMSPHGLVGNFLARSLVGAISSIISLALLLTLIAYTVKGKLHADPVPTFVCLALTYVNLIGFGFMTGGLVLVFKQIGQLMTLFRLALIFLVTTATTTDLMSSQSPLLIVAHLLPALDAGVCLKAVLLDGIGMDVFTHTSMYWLIFNSALWTIVGITGFKYMENVSRDKGTLGVY